MYAQIQNHVDEQGRRLYAIYDNMNDLLADEDENTQDRQRGFAPGEHEDEAIKNWNRGLRHYG